LERGERRRGTDRNDGGREKRWGTGKPLLEFTTLRSIKPKNVKGRDNHRVGWKSTKAKAWFVGKKRGMRTTPT